MASVPDYLVIETAFAVVQWLLVAPLTALASGEWEARDQRVGVAH